MAERLQKILAQHGLASRRHIEAWITAGRIAVNGHRAELGQKVDPSRDRVEVDGQVIDLGDRPELAYFLLNKPLGLVSTCADPQGRPTVLTLLPATAQLGQGLHPVGRLDVNSTGALILTNDGAFTYKLTHPRHHLAKTYRVTVQGLPTAATLDQWRQGVDLDGRVTQAAHVTVLYTREQTATLRIVLFEGRNRQIRRVSAQFHHPVISLHRTAIGPVQIKDLSLGTVRRLHQTEVFALESACNELPHHELPRHDR